MYDMDVQAINEKLRKCKAEMLLSNPCFLAVARELRSYMSSRIHQQASTN